MLCVNALLQTIQTPYVYHVVRVRAGVEVAGDGFFGNGNAYLRYELAIMGLFWSILWSVCICFRESISLLWFFRVETRHCQSSRRCQIPDLDGIWYILLHQIMLTFKNLQVKASFLAFYWRLFDGLPRYRKWWTAVAVFAAASYVGCWIAIALTCHPASLHFNIGRESLLGAAAEILINSIRSMSQAG